MPAFFGVEVFWIEDTDDAIAYTDDLYTGTAAINAMARRDLGRPVDVAASVRWLVPEPPATDPDQEVPIGTWADPSIPGAVAVVYATDLELTRRD